MKKMINLLAAAMLLPALGAAWGFHDAMWNGTPVICVTPKQSAMGGVWALPSSEAASVFLNPAELSLLDGPRLNASAAIIEWSASIYGKLDFNQMDTGMGGAGTLAFAAPLSEKVSAGAGISRVSDFGFNGVSTVMEELGPQLYQVYALRIMDAQGSLWEANAGLSVELADWLTAGFSGGLRFGSGSYEVRTDYVEQSLNDDTVDVDWETSEFCFHGGLLLPISAGTFALSGTNGTCRYRSRIALGFQREMEILSGSTMGVEFDVQSVDDDPAYSGRFFAYFAEMIPRVRSTYSVGFNRASDYHHTALCLGTGARIDLGDADLDLGVSWMSRSRQGYVFPEPFIDNIDDAGTYYSAGVSWKL